MHNLAVMKKVGGNMVESVPVILLCGWEGFSHDVIDPKKGLTWHSEADFGSGEYRRYMAPLESFIAEFHKSNVVKEKKLSRSWGFGLQLQDA